MAERAYIFEDTATARELERLRAIEAIFDPRTIAYLGRTGELRGRRFLEVGAGAGSVARFARGAVGPGGRVVAVDTSRRFLLDLEGVEVVEGDVTTLAAGAYESDVAHARYVLVHNASPGAVLDAILGQVTPGGFVLLEEPDFLVARALSGPEEFLAAYAAVSRAIAAMFRGRAMDPALGTGLPALLEERGVELVAAEHETHEALGGSPVAKMMRLSTLQLAEKYVATGEATDDDVAAHVRFADDPTCSAIYYATVRVLGRKRA